MLKSYESLSMFPERWGLGGGLRWVTYTDSAMAALWDLLIL